MFCVDTPEEREEWCKAIQSVSDRLSELKSNRSGSNDTMEVDNDPPTAGQRVSLWDVDQRQPGYLRSDVAVYNVEKSAYVPSLSI